MEFISLDSEIRELIQAAREARRMAHAPYSRFPVGAALLAADGRIFPGVNVENLSYGLTMCAERVAIGTAVSAGIARFQAIAIVAETDEPISPCGACRQVMAEFGEALAVFSATLNGKVAQFSLAELLPRARTGILNQP